MSEQRFHRAMELFEQACELDVDRRAPFLDQACDGDAELRREVEELLACDAGAQPEALGAGAGAFLLEQELRQHSRDLPAGSRVERPPFAASGGQAPVGTALDLGSGSAWGLASRLGLQAGELSGRQRGNYRLVRKIGEGGMGEVFEAEQAVPRRKVAIKVMRAGLSSARALRRFEHEAHVLGRLQHPGIAAIYEVGAIAPERPDDAFFAMELVEGLPLLEFAKARHLDTRARLELVARVCDAVQHAHQRGVIHRDLKPANIMVEHGGQPKVLDFGVARMAEDDGVLSRQLTSIGQIVGTLAYMAPEQIGGDPSQLDVRCDVYALGVILYQLLAGRLPLDPGTRPLAEAIRMIREQDPPTLGSVDRALRGDVETIVLKALEKTPARRYQSAAALAADLRRTLHGEPIEARQHSALYVARKMVRRHPVTAVAASLLAIGVSVFAVHARWQAERFRAMADTEHALRIGVSRAKEESDRLRDVADATAAQLAQKLRESDIERGRLFARTGKIGDAEALLWKEFISDPESLPVRYGLREAFRTQRLLTSQRVSDAPLSSLVRDGEGRLLCGDEKGAVFRVGSQGEVVPVGNLGAGVLVLDPRFPGLLLATCADRRLRVVDAETLEPRPSVDFEVARALAIDPARRRVAIQDRSRRVHLLSLPDLTPEWTSPPLASGLHALSWSPDGSMLAGGASNGRLHRWVTGEDEIPAEELVLEGHEGGIAALCWSPDGSTLLSGSSDRTVRVWSARDGALLAAWRYPNGTIRFGAFEADGRSAVLSGWWAVDRIDLASGERLTSVMPDVGPTGLVLLDTSDVGGQPSGSVAITAHEDGFVRRWSFQSAPDRLDLPAVAGPARCDMSRSHGRPLSAIGAADGRIAVRDAATGEMVGAPLRVPRGVRALRFAEGDSLLVVLTVTGSLHVLRIADGEELATASGADGSLSSVLDVSPDGTLVAVAAPGGVLRCMRSATLEVVAEANMDVGPLTGLAMGGPQGELAVVGRRRVVSIRDATLAELARTEPIEATPWCPAFSGDGSLLAAGTWQEPVLVWSLPTMGPVNTLIGHRALAWLVRFNPTDARLLYTAGEDGQLNAWDVPSGTLLTTWRPFPASDISGLGISVDGRLAVVTSSLGEACVLSLDHDDIAVAENLEAAVDRFVPTASPEILTDVRKWAEKVRNRSQAGRVSTDMLPESELLR